jgi:hypothetical protein
MTIFGKILVFVNLALSFLMLGWALGVYTEATDWYTEKPTPDKAQGEYYRLRERITPQGGGAFGLWYQVLQSEGRLKSANAAVAAVEAPRDSKQRWDTVRWENQRWYDDQLKDLTTSDKADKAVKEVVRREKEGDLVLDDKHPGRPLMQDAKDKQGKPLAGLAYYNKEFADTNDQIREAISDLNKWIAEDTDLTNKIGGPKGLRVRMANEEEKRLRVLLEHDFVKPLLVNSQVENELLQKRHRQLESRKAELMQQGGVAAR